MARRVMMVGSAALMTLMMVASPASASSPPPGHETGDRPPAAVSSDSVTDPVREVLVPGGYLLLMSEERDDETHPERETEVPSLRVEGVFRAGFPVVVKDKEGRTIVSMRADRSYRQMVLIGAGLKEGETYLVNGSPAEAVSGQGSGSSSSAYSRKDGSDRSEIRS